MGRGHRSQSQAQAPSRSLEHARALVQAQNLPDHGNRTSKTATPKLTYIGIDSCCCFLKLTLRKNNKGNSVDLLVRKASLSPPLLGPLSHSANVAGAARTKEPQPGVNWVNFIEHQRTDVRFPLWVRKDSGRQEGREGKFWKGLGWRWKFKGK